MLTLKSLLFFFFFFSFLFSSSTYPTRASTLWDSASANILKPLASTHKWAHKLTLLKCTSLTAHDSKFVKVLPLKLKVEFNNGIIMHKTVTGYAHSTPKLNFHSNQNKHPPKRIVPRTRLYLFKWRLVHSGAKLWNKLLLRIKILSDHKALK